MKKNLSNNYLKISQAAKALGVSPDTLRRWEKEGKITPQKTQGGTRLYPGFLKIGAAAKTLGVSIDTLRRWEKKGKIKSIRTAGGTRLYPPDMLVKEQPVSSTEELLQKLEDGKLTTFRQEEDALEVSVKTPQIEAKEKIYARIYARIYAYIPLLVTTLIITAVAGAVMFSFKSPTPKSGLAKNVLGALSSQSFLEINSDTQINGALAVRDTINNLKLEATPSASIMEFASGDTILTITESSTIDQDLSTASSPSFDTLNLSASKNQLTVGSGTLTWTPTATRTITLPDLTGEVSLLGQKISNSELENSKVTVSAGTNLTGGGDVSLGGSVTLNLTSSPAISGVLQLADGTAAAPSLTFTNDTDTGLYRIDANRIGLITGGSATSGITINGSGNVGIGAISPSTALHVVGAGTITGNLTVDTSTLVVDASVDRVGIGASVTPSSKLGVVGNVGIGKSFGFAVTPRDGLAVEGNVGIGTSSPDYALHVIGNAGIGTSLTVSSATSLASLNVSGISSLTGNVGIGASLTVSSLATFLSPLQGADGSATAPGLSFNLDPDTGIFRPSANALGFAANGTSKLTLTEAGSLGLGITSPSQIFQVNSGANSTVITSSGNVGIGITSPATALHIIGDTTFAGNLLAGVNNTYDIGTSAITFRNIYANQVTATTLVGTNDNANFTSSIVTINSDNDTNDTQDASLRFHRGTASPHALLTWDSTTKEFDLNSQLHITGTITGINGIMLDGVTNDIVTPGNETLALIPGGTGNVGLNTTSPYAKLQVRGAGTGTGLTFLTTDSTGAQRLAVLDNGNVGIGTTAPNGALSVQGSVGIGYTGASQVLPSNGLAVSGNVGIGTTTPDYPLHVVGNVGIGASATITGLTFSSGGLRVNGFSDLTGNVGIGGSLTANSLSTFLSSILGSDGSSTAPAFSFNLDTDTGIFRPGANALGFSTAGASRLTVTAAGLIGIGITSPAAPFQVNSGASSTVINSSGNVGVGTTSPLGALHVIGQCVVGNTKLRRRRKNKKGEWDWDEVEIKDIQPGDEILTLDEKTGEFISSKVNKLMDMGRKDIIKITTLSGKTIRTTAEHPYLVRATDSNILFEETFRRTAEAARRYYFEVLTPWDPKVPALNNEKISISRRGWSHLHTKARSKVDMLTRYFALPKVAAILSDSSARVVYEEGEDGKSKFWTLCGSVDGVMIKVILRSIKDGPKHFYSVIWKGEAGQKKRAVSRLYPRCRGMVTSQLFNTVIISQIASLSIGISKATLKGSRWIKVKDLQTGAEIATIDGWEQITQIEHLPRERVYDIEVEGTHNFVGNDIVAHNTYITGNVGIGTTAPVGALSVNGNVGIGGSSAGASYNFETWGTGRITSALTVGGNLGIGTSLTVDSAAALTSLNVSGISSLAGNVGIGGSLTANSLSTFLSSILGSDGSSTAPAFSFNLDTDTGIFRPGTNALGLTTGGTSRLTITAGGNLGIGLTNPATTLSVSGNANIGYTGYISDALGLAVRGNVGVGTTSPLGALHVIGQCVTGDTKLRRRKRNKKGELTDDYEDIEIKDIKEGDEILSLNEKTGKFEPHKVRGLMDMGKQEVFELTTESGKSIQTTKNHPYLVFDYQSENLNWLQKESFEYTEKLARKFYFEKLHGKSIYVPALKDKVNFTDEGWNHFVEKSRSLNEVITRFFALPRVKTVLKHAAKIRAYRKLKKSDMAVEYWTLSVIVDHILTRVVVCSIDGGPKFFLTCVWLGTKREEGVMPNKKELSLSPQNGKPLMLDRRRRLVTSQLFNKFILPENKRNVKWVKVQNLLAGQKIATIDGWEQIVSIKSQGKKQTFDIEVEGTHNFVGNDIVAHNTYITGNVGIGTTAPVGALSVNGNVGIGGSSAGAAYNFETWGTGRITSALTVGGNLGIGTSLTVDSAAALTSLNVSGISSLAGNVGIGGSLTANSLSTFLSSILGSDGSSTAPAFSFNLDTDTGIFRPGANALGFSTAGASRLTVTAAGLIGIGITSPAAPFQVNSGASSTVINSSGNVGVGTTSPLGALHVVGQCVAKGTRIRRRRKGNNGEWLEEEIPVEDIMPGDEVLSLNEATGKFEPHRVRALMDMGIQKTYLLVTETGKQIRTTANHPYLVRAEGLFEENQNSQEQGYGKQSKSDRSSDINIFNINSTIFNTHQLLLNTTAINNATIPATILIVNPQGLNLGLLPTIGTITAAPNHPADRLTNRSDNVIGQTLSISSTLPQTSKWIKVSQLKAGMEIVTVDGWEKIVSIEEYAREQVYDIEVEGTHNFVGNDIVAHNTYITGNVGIGTTAPVGALSVNGNVGIGGSSAGAAYNFETWGTGRITSALTVGGNLGIGTSLTVDSAAALTSLNVSGISSLAGNVGIGGSLTANSLSTFLSSILGSDGSSTAPAFSFNLDTDTGIFRPGANALGFSTAGASRLTITAAGLIGIGITSPAATFQVNSGSSSTVITSTGNIGIGITTANSALSVAGGAHIGSLRQGIAAPTNGLFVDGNVGIGATSSNNALDVWGDVLVTGTLTVGTVGNITSTGVFLASDGSASAPSYSFSGDTDTGLFHSTNLLRLTAGGVEAIRVDVNTTNIIQSAVSGGADLLSLNPANHTDVTAEKATLLTAGHTLTITGGYTNQRDYQFLRSSISAASALIVTNAATVAITGPTNAASSALITNSYGLLIEGVGGLSSNISNTYGLSVAASGGATNNYAAVFTGGNVGVGTSNPTATLSIAGNVGIGFTNVTIPSSGLAVAGNMGIGTTTANSKLSVAGGAHIGSLRQGIAAPTDGLFVDGNVGIGATTSNNLLDVWGATNITGNLSLGGVSLASDGTASAPSYSFSGDTNTGLFRPSTDALGLATAGSSRLTVTAAGLIGIGITSPAAPFQVNSGANSAVITSTGNIGIGITSPTQNLDVAGTARIRGSGGNTGLVVASNGNVGIGATAPAAELQINGLGFSAPTNPKYIAGLENGASGAGDGVNEVFIQGRYLYSVKANNTGQCDSSTRTGCEFQIYDFSNPLSPGFIGGADIGATANGLFVSGKYAYVARAVVTGACTSTASTGCEVLIYDISDPTTPTFVGGIGLSGSFNPGSNGSTIYVSGRYLYLALINNAQSGACAGSANTDCTFQIWDIGDPTSPSYAGGETIKGTGTGVANDAGAVKVQGRYAYVNKRNNKAGTCDATDRTGCELMVFDVSNPAAPIYKGGIDNGGFDPFNIAVSGRYAYMNTYSDVRVFDVSNPASPSLAATISITQNYGQTVAGRYLYIAQNSGSLLVYDVGNPASPAQVSSTTIGGSSYLGLTVAGRYAIVSIFGNTGACSSTTATGCEIQIYDLGGFEGGSVIANALEAGSVQVRENATIQNQLYVGGGAVLGSGGLLSQGTIGIGVSSGVTALRVEQFGFQGVGSTAPTAIFNGGNVGIGATNSSLFPNLSSMLWVGGNVGIGWTGTGTGTPAIPTLGLSVFGNVGIGTTTATAGLDVGSTIVRFRPNYAAATLSNEGDFAIGSVGTTATDGRVWVRSQGTTFRFQSDANTADYSEFFFQGFEGTEPGDVMVIDDMLPSEATDTGRVKKSASPYDRKLLGVVTVHGKGTGYNNPDDTRQDDPRFAEVGLLGHVYTKVSTENGPIEKGDYLTSSSTPGVAMKATRPGSTIGKALESFNGEEIGRILTFVNVSYADPGNFFASLTFDDSGSLIVPKIKTGSITLEPSLATASAQLSIVNSQLSINEDPSYQNPGPQLANNNNSYDLAGKIGSLEDRVKSLETRVKEQEATVSAKLAEATSSAQIAEVKLTPPDILLATGSATLANLKVTSEATFSGMLAAYDLNISNSLKSLGETILGKTLIAGDLTVDGMLTITGDSLSNLSTLYLQNSPLAQELDIFNGKVTIDKNGNITTQGKITASEIQTSKITISNAPVASSSATLAASIGTGTLPANTVKITIPSTLITLSSKIFITPTTPTDKVLSVTNIKEGESFDVVSSAASVEEIKFNWWIVQTN